MVEPVTGNGRSRAWRYGSAWNEDSEDLAARADVFTIGWRAENLGPKTNLCYQFGERTVRSCIFFFFLFELWKERMFFFRFLFCGRKREDEIYFGAEAMWEKFGHGSMNVSSWMALILCRKPKSNDNGKYKMEDWKRKRMEARVFHVVRLCEPTSTRCSQWATSLLILSLRYILDKYIVLWGVLFIYRTTNTTLISNLCGIP